jgi:hypothetical protein
MVPEHDAGQIVRILWTPLAQIVADAECYPVEFRKLIARAMLETAMEIDPDLAWLFGPASAA